MIWNGIRWPMNDRDRWHLSHIKSSISLISGSSILKLYACTHSHTQVSAQNLGWSTSEKTIMERAIDVSVPEERFIHHCPMALLVPHYKGNPNSPPGVKRLPQTALFILKLLSILSSFTRSLVQDTNTDSAATLTQANRCPHTNLSRDNCKPSAGAEWTGGKKKVINSLSYCSLLLHYGAETNTKYVSLEAAHLITARTHTHTHTHTHRHTHKSFILRGVIDTYYGPFPHLHEFLKCHTSTIYNIFIIVILLMNKLSNPKSSTGMYRGDASLTNISFYENRNLPLSFNEGHFDIYYIMIILSPLV